MRSVSRNPVNVMLRGESGTGKEVVARLIHQASDRRERPFVTVTRLLTVPREKAGERLDRYLSDALPGLSRLTRSVNHAAL